MALEKNLKIKIIIIIIIPFLFFVQVFIVIVDLGFFVFVLKMLETLNGIKIGFYKKKTTQLEFSQNAISPTHIDDKFEINISGISGS